VLAQTVKLDASPTQEIFFWVVREDLPLPKMFYMHANIQVTSLLQDTTSNQ